MDLGKQFLNGLGINLGGDPPAAASSPSNPGGKIPRANGRQAIEYVIRRMGSQMGVPYSWGGGSLDGPSKGVGDGANITGFDCSGLMRYGFAGVGVLIPRFSGDQYNAGRHIPQDQARRGDLIFYGPNGSQHVTMYLGNGQMLEASGSAGEGYGQPGAKARYDAVPDQDHRVLIRGVSGRSGPQGGCTSVDGIPRAWNSWTRARRCPTTSVVSAVVSD